MNGEELRRILCLLEPGMSLTVPDEWMDRTITGPHIKTVPLINKIALDFGCTWRQGNGVQTFEKLELAATG